RKAKRYACARLRDAQLLGIAERRELSRALERCLLLGGRLLGRAHALPGAERVRMIGVDPEVRELRLAGLERQPTDRQAHVGIRAGEVLVVVVPDERAETAVAHGRERRDVGLAAYASPDDLIEADRVIALRANGAPAQLREHAKGVEDGLRDAVRGERPESGEVGLILELERPRERALEVHAVLPRQLDLSSETCGGVARIHGPVSIGEVIALAGGAAFGIGLANDDWNAGELRVGRDHR